MEPELVAIGYNIYAQHLCVSALQDCLVSSLRRSASSPAALSCSTFPWKPQSQYLDCNRVIRTIFSFQICLNCQKSVRQYGCSLFPTNWQISQAKNTADGLQMVKSTIKLLFMGLRCSSNFLIIIVTVLWTHRCNLAVIQEKHGNIVAITKWMVVDCWRKICSLEFLNLLLNVSWRNLVKCSAIMVFNWYIPN